MSVSSRRPGTSVATWHPTQEIFWQASMATQAWTIQVIEEMTRLWNTLPLRGVTDERATIEDYGFALEGNSIEAIRNTVSALRRGEIQDASRDFCPRPPKLAEYVRAEQRRLDAVNRRPIPQVQYVERPWKDWREVHRRQMDVEGRAFIETVGLDQFIARAKQRRYPPGSVFYWSIDAVVGPVGSAGRAAA